MGAETAQGTPGARSTQAYTRDLLGAAGALFSRLLTHGCTAKIADPRQTLDFLPSQLTCYATLIIFAHLERHHQYQRQFYTPRTRAALVI